MWMSHHGTLTIMLRPTSLRMCSLYLSIMQTHMCADVLMDVDPSVGER